MISLDTLFTLRDAEPGRFHSTIPDGWQQGRGAFGGLVLGQMVAAAEASETDARRRLRSLTAELVGPVQPGAAEMTVEPLRRGSSVTALAVRLLQGGEVQAHAVALLAADRSAASWHEERPPSPPPWHAVPEIGLGASGVGPAFAEFFEYRPLSGAPFSGAETATTSGYIRSRLAVERPGAAWVTALADAWWSAAVARFTAVRPFATITFTLQMVLDPTTLDVTAPLFHRARAPHASDGYALEARELWTGDGRLVAVNHQTVAVLG